MVSYEEAKKIAIEKTVPGGYVYCSAEADDFYIFIITDVKINRPGLLTGMTYTAVDKDDGRVWTCYVTDPRLKNAKKIEGPKEDD